MALGAGTWAAGAWAGAWLARVPEFALAPGAEPRIPYPANSFGLDSLPLARPVPDQT